MSIENTVQDRVGFVKAQVSKFCCTYSKADQDEIIGHALVRLCNVAAVNTSYATQAIRLSVADFLQEQVEVPKVVSDEALEKAKQSGRIRLRRQADRRSLARWDCLLRNLPERQRLIAERLAAGWGRRDIAKDLGVGDGTISREVKAIQTRFDHRKHEQSAFWSAVLQVLDCLPDNREERWSRARPSRRPSGENAGLYQPFYPQVRESLELAQEQNHPKPIFKRSWSDAELVQETDHARIIPTRWFPGMPIHKAWSAVQRKQNWLRGGLLSQAIREVRAQVQGPRPSMESVKGKRVDSTAFPDQGDRWFYFHHAKHGWMLSTPLIQRNTNDYP